MDNCTCLFSREVQGEVRRSEDLNGAALFGVDILISSLHFDGLTNATMTSAGTFDQESKCPVCWEKSGEGS